MTTATLYRHGFTLIELSIVLVIIGLIVGGVLVGQDLVSVAAMRAQIAQIEKFNTAANTFYGKFGYLPGDIPDPYASKFGFPARGPNPGQGDGNGILQGIFAAYNSLSSTALEGEIGLFWVDLSTANIISGGFNTATATSVPSNYPVSYLPPAAIGQGNYVGVWTGCCNMMNAGQFGYNYFYIAPVPGLNYGEPSPTTYGLTPAQASAIDLKIDDGLPQSGKVEAVNVFGEGCFWSGAINGNYGGIPCYFGQNTYAQNPGASNSCMDNRNIAQGAVLYSTNNNLNCNLVIKMQGAAR